MDTTEYLFPLDVQLDLPELTRLALAHKNWDQFKDPLTGTPVKGWCIWRPEEGYPVQIASEIAELIESTDCRPRFYLQDAGTRIPFHTDRNTKCSFNFILTDDPAPIQFKWFAASYKYALLNVQKEHAVFASKEHSRLLFKVSVFDKTYEEVLGVLQSKLSTQDEG